MFPQPDLEPSLGIDSIVSFNRFPHLFPPLNPELVAQRTVEAVRTNTAFVYLPWTMRALVILKRLLQDTVCS